MVFNNIWKFFDKNSVKDYTLLIPSVAVGNVGQLSCDLLIASLQMKKIASVHSPALIPVVGYDPYDLNSNCLSTACEVYKSESNKILVLQLRSPVIHKYAKKILEDLVETFMKKEIRDVVILTSSFAHEKKHILTSPFRYIASDKCPYMDNIKLGNLTEHERESSELRIFGGGFASLLHEICTEKMLPSVILYKYCSEGDNIPDAYDMINYLSNILNLFSKERDIFSQLVQPVSWKLLFGKPPPEDIY